MIATKKLIVLPAVAVILAALVASGFNLLPVAQRSASASYMYYSGNTSTSTSNSSMSHSNMSSGTTNLSSSLNASSMDSVTQSSGKTKVFYLFNAEIPAINQSKVGFTGNVYSQQVLVVNKGDIVVIHFYNVETDPQEHHSFTLGTPYNINAVLAGGQNTTITFVANKVGIFEYHCIFHPPEMRGELVVLPWKSGW